LGKLFHVVIACGIVIVLLLEDTIHDTVFYAKVEKQIPRYATYDELSGHQANELVPRRVYRHLERRDSVI
jgi:hypothetical protein